MKENNLSSQLPHTEKEILTLEHAPYPLLPQSPPSFPTPALSVLSIPPFFLSPFLNIPVSHPSQTHSLPLPHKPSNNPFPPQITPTEAARLIRFLISRDLSESKRLRVFGAEYVVQWFDYPRNLRCQTVCCFRFLFSLFFNHSFRIPPPLPYCPSTPPLTLLRSQPARLS